MRMLLILGGYINYEWAAEFYNANSYDKVIAVDGGLSAANLLNVYPDSVIGDFDTVSSELVDKYEKENKSTIIRLNPIKDDTDTQYAIKHAMSIGAKEIHIIGGTGGRFDHSLANVFMLKMAYEQDVKVYMYDEINKIHVIDDLVTLKKDPMYDKKISFIQLEGPAIGVTLKGFVYNVAEFDFDTSKEYRIGVSNEFAGEEAEVLIDKGMFVVIETSSN